MVAAGFLCARRIASGSIPLYLQFGNFSELINVSGYQSHAALEGSNRDPKVMRADQCIALSEHGEEIRIDFQRFLVRPYRGIASQKYPDFMEIMSSDGGPPQKLGFHNPWNPERQLRMGKQPGCRWRFLPFPPTGNQKIGIDDAVNVHDAQARLIGSPTCFCQCPTDWTIQGQQ